MYTIPPNSGFPLKHFRTILYTVFLVSGPLSGALFYLVIDAAVIGESSIFVPWLLGPLIVGPWFASALWITSKITRTEARPAPYPAGCLYTGIFYGLAYPIMAPVMVLFIRVLTLLKIDSDNEWVRLFLTTVAAATIALILGTSGILKHIARSGVRGDMTSH